MSRLHLQSPESTPPSPSSSAVKRRQRGCVPHQRTCPPARPRRGDDGRDGGLRERRRGGVARVAGRVRPPARSPGQARLRGRGLLPPQPPRTPARPRPGPLHRQARAGRLLQWKLSRGKWRPRLMDFVKGLDGEVVVSASHKAFAALPDLSRAITELTVLKGIGPATASAVLAAYAPDIAPFMSDEAMVAVLGNAKEYTLKQYLAFADKLQATAKFVLKELMVGEESFTPSDVERALWSSAIGSKSPAGGNLKSDSKTRGKRKR